jgi:hypothetical protein
VRAWQLDQPEPCIKLGRSKDEGGDASSSSSSTNNGTNSNVMGAIACGATVSAVCADAVAKKVAVAYADGRVCILGQPIGEALHLALHHPRSALDAEALVAAAPCCD